MSKYFTWLPDWDGEELNKTLADILGVVAYFSSWVVVIVSIVMLFEYRAVAEMEGYSHFGGSGPILFVTTLVMFFVGGGTFLAEAFKTSAFVLYAVSAVFFSFPYIDASFIHPLKEGEARIRLADGAVYEAGETAPRSFWKVETVPFATVFDLQYDIPSKYFETSSTGVWNISVRVTVNPKSPDFKERFLKLLQESDAALPAVALGAAIDTEAKAHASVIFMPVVKEKGGASVGLRLRSDQYAYLSEVVVHTMTMQTTFGNAQ